MTFVGYLSCESQDEQQGSSTECEESAYPPPRRCKLKEGMTKSTATERRPRKVSVPAWRSGKVDKLQHMCNELASEEPACRPLMASKEDTLPSPLLYA